VTNLALNGCGKRIFQGARRPALSVEKRDHYKFHLIFKGLFRCVPDRENGRLSVLLVDARSPQKSVTGEPLRDHRAVIEFHSKDWRNKTADHAFDPPGRVRLVEVNKPSKGKVGLFFLDHHDLAIRTSDGQLSPPLKLIEDESPTSFSRLPQIGRISPEAAQVHPDTLNGFAAKCIARVLSLSAGEVRSERTSTLGGQPVQWSFSSPRERSAIRLLRRTPGEEREALREELERNAQEINLDLRVTADVPAGSFVIIDPVPFPESGLAIDAPRFLFKPRKGHDLEVWIKNRELDAILTESDREGNEEGCQSELLDLDFELQYELSTNSSRRLIPYRSNSFSGGDVTAGGCVCGGCTG
jgi:hypothetical protein